MEVVAQETQDEDKHQQEEPGPGQPEALSLLRQPLRGGKGGMVVRARDWVSSKTGLRLSLWKGQGPPLPLRVRGARKASGPLPRVLPQASPCRPPHRRSHPGSRRPS